MRLHQVFFTMDLAVPVCDQSKPELTTFWSVAWCLKGGIMFVRNFYGKNAEKIFEHNAKYSAWKFLIFITKLSKKFCLVMMSMTLLTQRQNPF